MREAVAAAADAADAAVPAGTKAVAEGTDAAGAAVATVAALAVVVLVSTTLAAVFMGCRPWLCWIKAKESGVSFLSAGRLLCRNTHTIKKQIIGIISFNELCRVVKYDCKHISENK